MSTEVISCRDFIFCSRENILFLKVHSSENKDNDQPEFWKLSTSYRKKNVPQETGTKNKTINFDYCNGIRKRDGDMN